MRGTGSVRKQGHIVKRILQVLAWTVLAILAATALATIALHRGEPISATWFVLAAACSFLVAYRFYSAFIAAKLLALDNTRATPSERHDDGRDFVPTNKWVLFGHHFAAIAGPGPLIGPTLAAQFGYLPGTLWLIAGAAFAGLGIFRLPLFLVIAVVLPLSIAAAGSKPAAVR